MEAISSVSSDYSSAITENSQGLEESSGARSSVKYSKRYLESGRRQVVPVPLTNFTILVSTLEETLRPAEVQVPESEAL